MRSPNQGLGTIKIRSDILQGQALFKSKITVKLLKNFHFLSLNYFHIVEKTFSFKLHFHFSIDNIN